MKALEGASEHPSFGAVDRIYVFTQPTLRTNLNRLSSSGPRLKWHNRNGGPGENAELWKRLIRVLREIPKRVDFEWVKGHAKDTHNKAVDKLAKGIREGCAQSPDWKRAMQHKSALTVSADDYDARRRLSMQIITDTYMRVQKLYKYKYEILPDNGTLSGKLDLIFHKSKECLCAGHHYEVRVNSDTKNPRVSGSASQIPSGCLTGEKNSV